MIVFKRRIQFDLVTIFVALMAFSALFIVFFNYEKNLQGVLKLSTPRMHQMRNGVLQRLAGTTDDALLNTQIIQGMVALNANAPIQQMWPFLFNLTKYDDAVSTASLSTRNGELLSAIDLTVSNRRFYYSRPLERLPETAKYAMRFVQRSGNTLTETWTYFGSNLQVLATEVVPVAHDVRTDALFITEQSWPTILWDYSNSAASGPGLSITAPLFDQDNAFFGFTTLHFSLDILSNALVLEDLNNVGGAFVLDQAGSILLPSPLPADTYIPRPVVESAFHYHEKSEQDDFVIKNRNTRYLISMAHFPMSLETRWLVTFIIPLNDFFGPLLKTQRESLLIALVIVILSGILAYFLSKHISRPIVQLAQEVDQIKEFNFTDIKPVQTSITELITLDSSIIALQAALRSFQHYLPKEIVQTLVKKGQEVTLGGERREVTVLFSDVKDFTTLSEAVPIDELTKLLTNYFGTLSKIILEHEGTIDKYIGDSIMCFWNAPQDVVNHATKACLTVLLLQKACLKMKAEGELLWETRFGLHMGDVIVGNIGTEQRMNYTVMGNTVNTASRLQALNKDYHSSILISDTVHELIGAQFISRPLDFIAVKGKKNRIAVYELLGLRTGDAALLASPEELALSEKFSDAFALFHDGKIKEAQEIFLQLQKQFPHDYPISYYLERIKL